VHIYTITVTLFGYIQNYTSTDVSVFLGKMCKTNLFFYYRMTDVVALRA